MPIEGKTLVGKALIENQATLDDGLDFMENRSVARTLSAGIGVVLPPNGEPDWGTVRKLELREFDVVFPEPEVAVGIVVLLQGMAASVHVDPEH